MLSSLEDDIQIWRQGVVLEKKIFLKDSKLL